MFTYRNLMTVCCAAVLAFGLAACGSDDKDTAMDEPTMMEPMEPMEPTPVAVAVADFMYLSGDQMPMAMMHEIAAGGTATNGGVTYLCAVGGDDCMVTVGDDGMATSTGGTVTASLTEAGMMQVADAKEMMAGDAEMARLVRRNRAIGEDTALEGATRMVRATADPVSMIDIANIIPSRGAGATARVRVTAPTGYSQADNPAMMNGDWTGARLSRATGPNTDELVVYTDIDEPTLVQFYNFDASARTPSRYTDAAAPMDANNNNVPYTPVNNPNTPLAIGPGGQAFTRGVLDPNEFPQPGPSEGGLVTMRYAVSATTNMVSFRGNYNGAGGTYTCTNAAGTPCIVTVSPAGAYAQAAGTWTFTPELNARAYQSDATFMSFGWWLRTPASADGAYSYSYYADGGAFVPTATVPTGTATYNGRAAGRYVVQEVGAMGVTDGVSGEFIAAATLTANFDAMSTAGLPAPTIQGSISGFQGEMGGMSGWAVALNRQTLADNAAALGAAFTSGQIDPTASRFDGVTATMGDQTAYGSWTGQFFGNQMTVGEVPAAVAGAAPVGVGGTFQADNEAVNIAGAFGARR